MNEETYPVLSETKRIKRLEWAVLAGIASIIFGGGQLYTEFAQAKNDIKDLQEDRKVILATLIEVKNDVKWLRDNQNE